MTNPIETIPTYDALTALEIMERMAEGESLEKATERALAIKAAVEADPWHLEEGGKERLAEEVARAGTRLAQVEKGNRRPI
jgi:hypothetical protein